MRSETKFFIFILFFLSFISADNIKYNNANNHGIIGLINTPSARFYDESSSSLTFYRGNPDRKISLSLMPYDWLEASVFYTSIKDRSYGGDIAQDYKDKGFNLKIRLKEEGVFPAIAIGLNDFGGTGIYSSEYIVASYGRDNIDFSLGIGWGALGSGKYTFKNPLSNLDSSFSDRSSMLKEGGTFRKEDLFSGKKAAFFGGINYIYSDDFSFLIEFDSTQIDEMWGFPKKQSYLNYGINFIGFEHMNFGITIENNDFIGMRFALKSNFFSLKKNNYKNTTNLPSGNLYKLKKLLEINNITPDEISSNDDHLKLTLQQYIYKDKEQLNNNVVEAVQDAGYEIESIVIAYKTAGLYGEDEQFGENHNKKISYKNTFKRDNTRRFNFSSNISYRPFIASREDFLKGAILLEGNAQYVFSDNFFWTTNLKYALWDNFEDLYIPPEDTYPNQVRSDIKKYLNHFNKRIILGRSQIDLYKTFNKKNHIQISAGIFEEMFSGYGFEYLWNKNEVPFAFGFEVFKVFKRDYRMNTKHQDYSNITGHLNMYYKNKFRIPFDLKISYGEYLAGDIGFTFDISRRFKNGVSMGAFFTRTNVSFERFGEGSFDKGIYFNIPLKDNWFSTIWRPLTKDPGAKLIRKDNIYDLIRIYKD